MTLWKAEVLWSINERLGRLCSDSEAGVSVPPLGHSFLEDSLRMARKQEEEMASLIDDEDADEGYEPMIGGYA